MYDSEADEHKVKPTRIFFPTRAVPYRTKEQCSQTEFCTANEADEARLNEFIKVVEASGGRLDTSRLSFGCIVHGMLQVRLLFITELIGADIFSIEILTLILCLARLSVLLLVYISARWCKSVIIC